MSNVKYQMSNPARVRELLRRSWPWTLIVFVLTLAAYIRTLLPGTAGGDAGELQYAGPLLTLTHPTGHPLYVLLGFIWSHVIPIGAVAYRMNLLAAVSGAAGCAILAWVVHRLHQNPIVALAAGLTLGLGETYWQQAIIADKYAFNTIFVSLVIGLALWWARDRKESQGNRLLYALCLAYGLSLLHHRTMILFAPWLALLFLYHERGMLWRDRRRTLICLALVFLPALIVYPVFLPLARDRALLGLSPNTWIPQGLNEWVNWIQDRQYIPQVLVLSGIGQQIASYFQTLLRDYTLVVIAGALLGLVFLVFQQPASAIFLVFSFVTQAVLAANYRDNARPFTYFPPSYIVLVYAYAYGLIGLWKWLRERAENRPRFGIALNPVLSVAMIAIPLLQFNYAYPIRRLDAVYGQPLDVYRQVLKSGNLGDRLAARMADLPQNAVVLADWEQITVLWYKQKVEGVRPDLTLIYPIERLGDFAGGDFAGGNSAGGNSAGGNSAASSRPICLARMLPVGAEWHPTNIGPLVCLSREAGTTIPGDFTPIGKPLLTPGGDQRLELAAYRIDQTTIAAGQYVPVVLAWRALIDHPEDYSVSLHILTEDWQQVWAQDIAAPVLGMYPTSRWVQGEVVMDYHEFAIPREMPPGRYLWTVVVYRRLGDGSFEQLRDADGNIEVLGGTFEVTPR